MKGFCAVIVGGLVTLSAGAVRAQSADAIDLSAAVLHGEPVAAFPITATIERVELRRSGPYRTDGIVVVAPGVSAWPDVHAMGVGGTGGALQYTTWVCVRQGQLHCGGFIQHWRTEDGRGTGAPWLHVRPDGRSNWQAEWAYDGRWGAMADYVPRPGDAVYIFLVAGNTRTGQAPEYAVVGGQAYRARTNVVAFAYPANDQGVFTFAPQPPTQPGPLPDPQLPPGPSGGDLAALSAHVRSLTATVEALRTWADERFATVHEHGQALESRTSTLEFRVDLIERRPPPALKCHGYLNLLIVRVPFAACRVEPE